MSQPLLVAILAAGASTRFGSDKLAADCGGAPLGQRALDAARSLRQPVVWIGRGWAPPDCEVIANPLAERGQGTSVALAARIAQERGAEALLILLADMPLVGPELLARLLTAGAPAACRYPDGHAGPPALLPAASFAALARLDGGRGAGAHLRSLPGLTLIAPTGDELADIDRPEDLARIAPLCGKVL